VLVFEVIGNVFCPYIALFEEEGEKAVTVGGVVVESAD
jgi:hypothetical protein